MRALLPEPVDHVDVHDHYSRDWVERGGIRVNMVSSVDGAGSVNGASAGLQTSGDNAVFAALRDLADVVLVAAGTAAAEGYRPITIDAAGQAGRRSRGFAEQLPTAVVSRSLHGIDPDAALYTVTEPRTIVLTTEAADAELRARLSRTVDLVLCGAAELDLSAVRQALTARGLRRVLCEGGPTFLGALAGADQVDELCLSLTPLLAGPGAERIMRGDAWPDAPHRLALAGLLEEDGALFLRLRRGPSGG